MRPNHWLLGGVVAIGVIFSAAAHAQQGYALRLEPTTPDARHDPDGVWDDGDLAFIRKTGRTPVIYTARITTPAGEWLLSQTNGDCNMQGMCTALLILKKQGGEAATMANPQLPLGGTAMLSLNYKKLITKEIDQDGHAVDGVYEVAPIP